MRIDKGPVPQPGTTRDPLYPSSDGKSLAETDFHSAAVTVLRASLEDIYAAARRTDVVLVSDVLLSGETATPCARRDLDVFIVRGLSKKSGPSICGWEGGKRPVAVFEVASDSTYVADTGPKFEAYQRLGIREYFLFDPEGAFYDPTLIGYRLVRGRYVPIRPVRGNILPSEQLGLWLEDQGGVLRVIDPAAGRMVPTRLERIAQAEKERHLARSELREERLLRLRAERAARRADEEAQRARDRVRELEDELRRLQSLPPA
jgi:Uma2 family endonuclease